VICREQGYAVDVEAADRIVKSAEAADGPIDAKAAIDPAHRAARDKLAAPVVFTGYEREEDDSEVVAILKVGASGDKKRRALVDRADAGDHVEIVVAATPFYGEAGGQVGDIGAITGDALRVTVTDTQKPVAGLVVHEGVVKEGAISVGQRVHVA